MPSLVSDFDGTLVRLSVDWLEIRRLLKVDSINDLWTRGVGVESSEWKLVAHHECLAAQRSRRMPPPTWLDSVASWSVLTNNSAKAVEVFLTRMSWSDPPWNVPAPVCIVGREELAGSKEDFCTFANAIRTIANRMNVPVGRELAYLGDRSYEIAYAARLGLDAVRVSAPR